jgi:hypothetical protein
MTPRFTKDGKIEFINTFGQKKCFDISNVNLAAERDPKFVYPEVIELLSTLRSRCMAGNKISVETMSFELFVNPRAMAQVFEKLKSKGEISGPREEGGLQIFVVEDK